MSKEKNCVQKTEGNQELFSATVFLIGWYINTKIFRIKKFF